jgi:uncharacterized protein (DUF1778 family)
VAKKTASEVKVRPTSQEKELFELAAEKSRRSLSQWMIVAALEKAERDGVRLEGRGKASR